MFTWTSRVLPESQTTRGRSNKIFEKHILPYARTIEKQNFVEFSFFFIVFSLLRRKENVNSIHDDIYLRWLSLTCSHVSFNLTNDRSNRVSNNEKKNWERKRDDWVPSDSLISDFSSLLFSSLSFRFISESESFWFSFSTMAPKRLFVFSPWLFFSSLKIFLRH